jgi:transcriptional regulator with XRE-family HTH domain
MVRRSRGLKQRDAAEALGLDNSYYCKVENGQLVPSPEVARRIVRFFGAGRGLTEMHILYPQDYAAKSAEV